MFRFEGLNIWKLAVSYGKECYKIADKFPKYELFSLSDQLRRAAVSISNNIAEGSVGSDINFRKFINISVGSTLETVNIINFALEMNYVDRNSKDKLYKDAEILIIKMRSFSKSLI